MWWHEIRFVGDNHLCSPGGWHKGRDRCFGHLAPFQASCCCEKNIIVTTQKYIQGYIIKPAMHEGGAKGKDGKTLGDLCHYFGWQAPALKNDGWWAFIANQQNSKTCLLDADLDKQSVISQVGNIVARLPDVHFHSWKNSLSLNHHHLYLAALCNCVQTKQRTTEELLLQCCTRAFA